MKRCPTCDNTFEDSLRFCQADGTPLVEDAPPLDPYATMVASSAEIKAASEADNAPVPIAEPDNMLDLPAAGGGDLMKTMVASAEEMRQILEEKDDPGMEIPEAPSVPVPEPPKFAEPEIAAPHFSNAPNFSEIAPPPPSPFEVPKPGSDLPAIEDEPPTMMQPFPETAPPPPFQPAATPPAPPAAPVAQFEPASPASSAPVPPSAAAGGQNKTLAIVSMIIGILGLTLCCGSLIPSVVAVITGFMARGKAANDPLHYGGGTFAMVGLITGVLGLLASIAYLVFLFAFGGLQLLMGR
ncbi:MAG: hypothetical protein UZ17_ACD001000534 [Acidobacteria bacterium OLB17]|nr:MAG: hypothetical protein UZ17_ACD001000534 [Acidobacteria bacterium OLB17]MCZ2389609.1 DUF4190 domain-containing protein [Acidobacteriota bacterium]